MKKIFTLISMAMVAMSMNAQTDNTESYTACDLDGNLASEFASVLTTVDDGKGGTKTIAGNVVNGNSIVKFGTANVDVEAVGSADPADLVDPNDVNKNVGQDITVGSVIDADDHTYELVSINSTKDITWTLSDASNGSIDFKFIKGTGTPAVSMYAKENSKDGAWQGNYSVVVVPFDPAVGGEPLSGLYYKFTTKVDGALKVGIWANKGNRTTFLVDSDTKIPSEYVLEGYMEGVEYVTDKPILDENGEPKKDPDTGETAYQKALKWLTNSELQAIKQESNTAAWVIGNGKQFWGNIVIDAKAGKTYWLFQGNAQIGFNGYTFVPGANKEDLVDGIQSVASLEAVKNAPMYNLAGQKVSKDFKGIAIQNGRKFVVK